MGRPLESELGRGFPRTVNMPEPYWVAVDSAALEGGISRSELFRRLIEGAGLLGEDVQAAERAINELAAKDPEAVGSVAWRRKMAATAEGRRKLKEWRESQ